MGIKKFVWICDAIRLELRKPELRQSKLYRLLRKFVGSYVSEA